MKPSLPVVRALIVERPLRMTPQERTLRESVGMSVTRAGGRRRNNARRRLSAILRQIPCIRAAVDSNQSQSGASRQWSNLNFRLPG